LYFFSGAREDFRTAGVDTAAGIIAATGIFATTSGLLKIDKLNIVLGARVEAFNPKV